MVKEKTVHKRIYRRRKNLDWDVYHYRKYLPEVSFDAESWIKRHFNAEMFVSLYGSAYI